MEEERRWRLPIRGRAGGRREAKKKKKKKKKKKTGSWFCDSVEEEGSEQEG